MPVAPNAEPTATSQAAAPSESHQFLAVATDPAQADVFSSSASGLRVTAGGMLLWAGTVSIGASTVVLLAILSRHLHHEGFATLSTLFGLFFVASLIPSGIPLRAAALEVDGATPMRITASQAFGLTCAGIALSPPVAFGLHLPVIAVLFVAVQVVVAIPLGIRRGSLIARQRFDAMGGNLLLEAATRSVLGTIAGLAWGLAGLSAALAVATAVAFLAAPRRRTHINPVPRRLTSMLHTWLSLVLLGVFVQLDIVVAPNVLPHSAATRYDLAAVPSKGVYLVLLAASTLIFPYVRMHARRRTVVLAAAGTLTLGLLVTGVLLVLRPTIAVVLGQNAASPSLLLALGVAMSIAGATGIVINSGIALGVGKPWPPLLLGIAGVLIASLFHPTVFQFGCVVFGAQVVTLLVCIVVCLRSSTTP